MIRRTNERGGKRIRERDGKELKVKKDKGKKEDDKSFPVVFQRVLNTSY